MQSIEVKLHEKPKYELKIQLTKKQLEVVQDALGYSAWQFEEGGADPRSSIKLLDDLHKEIKKQTGVESKH